MVHDMDEDLDVDDEHSLDELYVDEREEVADDDIVTSRENDEVALRLTVNERDADTSRDSDAVAESDLDLEKVGENDADLV